MKRILSVLWVILFSAVLIPGSVGATYYMDTTSVIAGNANDFFYQQLVPGYIGDLFETKGVSVNFSDGILQFDIWTRFDGYDAVDGKFQRVIHDGLADFGLDFDGDGYYEYGVDLTWDPVSEALTSSGVYKAGNTSYWNWARSAWFFQGRTAGDYYYGRWLLDEDNDIWNNPGPMVEINTLFGNWDKIGDVSELYRTVWPDGELSGGTYYDIYQYHFGVDLRALGIESQDGDVGYFFATSDSASDVVENRVEALVPEPTTILLLGCGMAMLAFLRKRTMRLG